MTYQDLWHRLTSLHGDGEAQTIVRLVLEVQLGITLTDIYMGKVNGSSRKAEEELERTILRLERLEPIQYVLGRETFCGCTFHVAPGALIPHPGTGVLCRWTEEDYNRPYCALQPLVPLRVLDVGADSGCITVTLAADLRNSAVTVWDISGDILLVVRENVYQWQVRVELKMEGVFHPSASAMQQKFDVIVSNPPYIRDKERTEMEGNVLAYEPGTALFVPDDDPLRFYRAIAECGVQALSADGVFYFEINPLYTNDVKEMLNTLDYKQIESREDQFGKLRFIKATRP